jgi:hypothetical protein
MNCCSIILGNVWNDSHYACTCEDSTHQHPLTAD